MQVDIKLDREDLLPTYATSGACGADIRCAEITSIQPNEVKLVPTGVYVKIPENTALLLLPRSGITNELQMANSIGLIDVDYRGQIMCKFRNISRVTVYIEAGDRLGQLLLVPYIPMEFVQVDALDETERGAGGFGSTGDK